MTSPPTSPRTPDTSAHQAAADTGAAAALVILWSSGFVGARLGVDHAEPLTLLAWRFAISAALLMVWWRIRSPRRPRRSLTTTALAQHATIGVFAQVLYLGGVFSGVASGVSAGTVALIAALQPLVVANASRRLLGTWVSARQRFGLWLGISGVAVVVADDLSTAGTPLWAYALPVGSMLALSAGTVLDRRWRPDGSTLQAFTIHTVTAAILVTAIAAVSGGLVPPSSAGFWAAVAWVTVLSGFGGYGMYLIVLRRNGPTHVSVLLYLTPPTTLVWTWAMFGDGIGPRGLAGFAICAAAVYLVLKTPARRQPKLPLPSTTAASATSRHDVLTSGAFLSSWWARSGSRG